MKLTVITLDVSEPDVYDTKSINLLSLTLNRMIEMVSAVSLLGHMTIILFTKSLDSFHLSYIGLKSSLKLFSLLPVNGRELQSHELS